MAVPETLRLSPGQVCAETFRQWRSHAGVLLPLGLLLLGPVAVLGAVAVLPFVPSESAIVNGNLTLSNETGTGRAAALVCLLLSAAFMLLLAVAAGIRVAATGILVRRVGLRDALRFARESVPAAIRLELLLIAAGAVPGALTALDPPVFVPVLAAVALLYLTVKLCRALPAAVLEGAGLLAAVQWSWAASRARWWATLAPFALVALALPAGAGSIVYLLGYVPYSQATGAVVVTAIAVIYAALMASLVTVLFLNGYTERERAMVSGPFSAREPVEVDYGRLRRRLAEDPRSEGLGQPQPRGRAVAGLAALLLAPGAILALGMVVNPWDLPRSTIVSTEDAPPAEIGGGVAVPGRSFQATWGQTSSETDALFVRFEDDRGHAEEKLAMLEQEPRGVSRAAVGVAPGVDGPVVVYWERDAAKDPLERDLTGYLRVVTCRDPRCSDRALQRVRISPSGGPTPEEEGTLRAAVEEGRLAVVFNQPSLPDPTILVCELRRCSQTLNVSQVAEDTGFDTLDVVFDHTGRPTATVAEVNAEEVVLFLSRCSDTKCTRGRNERVLELGSPYYDWHVDLELGADGFPVMAYSDWSEHAIKFIRCLDARCSRTSTATLATLDLTAEEIDLRDAATGEPKIAFRETSARGQDEEDRGDKLLTCSDRFCGAG